MEFDSFSVVMLVLRPDAPLLDDEQADSLQDAHMEYLASLHETGALLAAGPLLDDHYRGLVIMSVTSDEARELLSNDPAVRAGRFELVALDWMTPEGVLRFGGSLPTSMQEVRGDPAS